MTAKIMNAAAWAQTAKALLALSAAVSLNVLDQQDDKGNYLYARGRHKYFGIGALVIFFAVFSGYGMAHMLATMANVSATGAVIAGSIWALFQWCLERQMIMSIHAESSLASKLQGFSWRALLAALSAVTMVYPFFVDSNRAEIDVRVAEMSREKQILNLQTAQAASGVPDLRQEAEELGVQLQKAEENSRSDPPNLAALRTQLQQCREHAKEQERRGLRQIRIWQQELTALSDTSADAVRLVGKISQQQASIDTAKRICQRDEQQINHTILAWRNDKLAEKTHIATQLKQSQVSMQAAKAHSIDLAQVQEKKIALAAQAGFAADFAATWNMLQNDDYRRLQFIWWLLWFLTIELVAIIVKFSSSTDVDARLHADESLVRLDINTNRDMRAAQIRMEELRHAMRIRGEEIALQADAGKSTAALLTVQQLCQLQEVMANAGKDHETPEVADIMHQTISAIQAAYLRQVAAH
ncbi:DUF4407 domain-containing protein [Undibacterium sp. TS12]|uniref:DUF4407 domain-containing protein n=1 Tax=Undibacterium sp. TS12 TaxID=2908202 RepID=UPI001F4C5BB6|nr:DUF4407 domain-containing protein [Undibacterium sp. TS12]MCH8619443.1 DUF4407 domain-containing protein [Undibacterium sp. TS12]